MAAEGVSPADRLAARERARARIWLIGLTLFILLFGAAAAATDFDLKRLIGGLPRTVDFFAKAAPDLEAGLLLEDEKTKGSLRYWFHDWNEWAALVLQSVEMALLATVAATLIAFPLAFLTAKPTSLHPALHMALRRLFELLRTIPDIVLALIFVFAFGIGPVAGVLAITIHSTGALGKLFAEAIENIDMRPLDGVRACGGGAVAVIRLAAVPQCLPNIASYALLRFEINVGAAAAIGFVGAGGIGEAFVAAIAFNQFQDAAAMMLMTTLVIFALDLGSEAIRHRLTGGARQ